MPVTVKNKNGNLTALIKGEIDHHSAPAIREAIDDAVIACDSFNALVLDFADVTFMDSSGVGLVMGRCRLCSGMGKKVIISNLNERNGKIMKMSGIEKIAEIKNIYKESAK